MSNETPDTIAKQEDGTELVTVHDNEIGTLGGVTLKSPILFDYTFSRIPNVKLMQELGKTPNLDSQLELVNGTSERNAQSKARAAAGSGELEKIQSTREYRVNSLAKSIVDAAKGETTQAEALAMAENIVK